MSQGEFIESFFPSSHAIITGGTFTIHNSTHIHNNSKGGYERLLEAVASNALYDSGHLVDPPKCLPGTRVAVLQTIADWVVGINVETRDKDFIWLCGGAGAGKSAIGRSICERCARDGLLLASFFFGSRDPTRNNSKSLVATIAYQICAISPEIRRAVSDFIDYDPLIFTRSMQTQLSSLILDPLASAFVNRPSTAPRLIVIDGLDECINKASQREILDALYYASICSRIPIRFLVCSRPENQLSASFNSARMSGSVFKIFLGTEYSSYEDIKLYVQDRFKTIKEDHTLKDLIPPSWPSTDDIHQIVLKSSGQFIYAKTVMEYLESSQHRPQQRLEEIFGLRSPYKDLPFAELDALYTHILVTATDNPTQVLDILVFVALYPLLRIDAIETMLRLEPGDVKLILSGMGSLVRILDEHNLLILLHKSFEDFIFDPHRSKELSIDRMERKSLHLVRVIEIFSDNEATCFPAEGYYYLFELFREYKPAQPALIEAIKRFPVNTFYRSVYRKTHADKGCYHGVFIYHLFRVLSELARDEKMNDVYHDHVRSYCNQTLFALHTKYSNNWQKNYCFSVAYLAKTGRELGLFYDQRGEMAISTLIDEQGPVPKTLRMLLKAEERALIVAKAAAYCLQCVCDVALTNKEASLHLEIGGMNRRMRSSCPWKWRKHLARGRGFTDMPVIMEKKIYKRQWVLTTYGRLTHDRRIFHSPIYNVSSLDLAHTETDDVKKTQIWSKYLSVLEYLVRTLPHAGHYRPLIGLCKTESFAPMSMMFPDISRRARREMSKYLVRMESDRGIVR